MMNDNLTPAPAPKKKCFVVMGFGEKTDFATGRTLDLDKSYRLIIKKAVEEAGLECIRADDIIHASVIDKPMYEWLFAADLVVADLSTTNANAIYELGVRHALKPRTTIVIAESQFKFPFDLGHLLVRKYEHLGKGIDGEEADRAKEDLKKAIAFLIDNDKETDSPVYTFLPTLATPGLKENINTPVAAAIKPAGDENGFTQAVEKFKKEKEKSNWPVVIFILNDLLDKRPDDVYLKQQLALATYKSKQPSVDEALQNAKDILEKLNPKQITDPETLGLWGAIHKRFWEVKTTRPEGVTDAAKPDLDEAIWAYEKGFYLKNDFYNGINFAFLLNVRAAISVKREAIADIVFAERIRQRVILLCKGILEPQPGDLTKAVLLDDPEQKFWVQASLVEAYLGTNQKEQSDKLKAMIITGNADWKPAQWMVDTMNEQLAKLAALLEKAPTIE